MVADFSFDLSLSAYGKAPGWGGLTRIREPPKEGAEGRS